MTGIMAAAALFSCDDLYTGVRDEVYANYFHGTKQFTASDGAENNEFGRRVAVSSDGTTIVVGNFHGEGKVADSGSAYVYRWNGSAWVEAKIMAEDGAAGDQFGFSVAISDDGSTIVIGAMHGEGKVANSGSAYVYRWNGSAWVEAKIMAQDGVLNDQFGYSVAVSAGGNIVVVGADADDDNGSASGSVYVYRWNGTSWEEVKIIADDGALGDLFGWSVAISSDGATLVVGAKYDTILLNEYQGSAYVYRWNGSLWWFEKKITASDGFEDDQFGYSVAISADGNTLVIGASGDDDKGSDSGAAYVYHWNGSLWEETKITASDGAIQDWFGTSISMSGDGTTLVIGALGDDDNGSNASSAYVYRWDGSSWVEEKIIAGDGLSDDWFGIGVAVSSDSGTVVVGASQDDVMYNNQGSVWLYAE